MAIPPLTPGIWMVCTTAPLATFTIRTSLRPRPADRVQAKRPAGGTAPPAGWLPRLVSVPGGLSWRPLGWMWLAGPMMPSPEDCASAKPAPQAPKTSTHPSSRRIGAESSQLHARRATALVKIPLPGSRAQDRLHVEHWSAVERLQIADLNPFALDRQHLDLVQADRVRPVLRSRAEHARQGV